MRKKPIFNPASFFFELFYIDHLSETFSFFSHRLSNLTRIPKELIEESEPLQVRLFFLKRFFVLS